MRISVESGVRCSVREIAPRGYKKTIVFVHGWPLNGDIFECQYDVLPEYGLRCISIDLRGFGASDKPWRGYSYDSMAEDLCKIFQELDLRNVTLCGFSMGGAVCVRYMARYNNSRVSKLVLMGAAVPSFTQRAGYPYGMTTEQINDLIVQAYNDRPQCVTNFARLCFASNPSAQYLDWIASLALQAGGWSTIKTAEALRDEDLRADLQKIRVPTAIFHGRQDRVCPFAFAEEMRKGIANSFVVPFEQSGHALFYDERNKCNSQLLSFICGAPL